MQQQAGDLSVYSEAPQIAPLVLNSRTCPSLTALIKKPAHELTCEGVICLVISSLYALFIIGVSIASEIWAARTANSMQNQELVYKYVVIGIYLAVSFLIIAGDAYKIRKLNLFDFFSLSNSCEKRKFV